MPHKLLRALAAALLLASAGAAHARPVRVQLLAINDLHGNLQPPEGKDGQVNGVPAGGIEYLAAHLRAEARRNPHTLIVAAGDLMGASPLLSSMFDEAPTVEALNAMGLDVTSIGNHELDNGPDALQRRIAGRCPADRRCEPARYRYLAANVLRGGAPLEPPVDVRTVGGVKIGFIGETLQGARDLISPSSAKGLTFEDEAQAANRAAARLQRQGVRAIVLLIHQGGRQTPPQGAAIDPNGCVGFTGGILPILPKLSPAIRVVVSAHTHEMYNCRIDGRLVTSAGAYGRLFTRLDLTIDSAGDRLLKASAVNEVVTRDVPKDPAETAVLARYEPAARRLAERPVGALSAPLRQPVNAAGESGLGDVVADAMLESGRSWDPAAQLAVTNPGGLRTDIAGAPGASGPLTVTYGQVFTAAPFGNRLVSVTLTGDQLRRLLEEQFVSDSRVAILQVSHGLAYRYRLNAPAGQHVEPGSLTLDGRPIAPDERVRVVTTNYLLQGGDGHRVFAEGADPREGVLDREALVAYFGAHSPVAPGPQDRIRRTD
jgi:5'-nucleotidase